jgi:hypothetical protein
MTMPKRGATVANGATIIDIKRAWDPSGFVVLCLRTDTQADPYVTWIARMDGDAIICTGGRYFDQLKDAVVDFSSRV